MIQSYVKLIRLGILVAAIAASSISINRCSEEVKRSESLIGNVIHYQDAYSNSLADRAVLELESHRLRFTNDILVRELDSIARLRKIDLRRSGSVAARVSTNINTKDTTVIPVSKDTSAIKNCDFKITINPNNETMYIVQRKNDTIIHEADINNEQSLFVYPKREYVNKYNTWLGRLFRLDFKKVDLTRYHIENSNDEIKITDTKVFLVK